MLRRRARAAPRGGVPFRRPLIGSRVTSFKRTVRPARYWALPPPAAAWKRTSKSFCWL